MDNQNNHFDQGMIANVADRLRAHPFEGWFYGDSVGFEGLVAASDLTGRGDWLDFSHGFFRAWATRMEPFGLDDNTAPGHVMCDVVERRDDETLRTAVIALAQHLKARRKVGEPGRQVSITFEDTLRSLRQPYGGVPLDAEQTLLMDDPGPGVWLDCMHFDPPFFAHLAGIDPDPGFDGGWSRAAIEEILGCRDLLLDRDTGLYRHFWLERTGRSYIDGWGRGQGWALLGLLDVARYAPIGMEDADEVRAEAVALARRMLAYQLEDGNWHCMVHEPRSGPESSTAAFMATAFYRGIADQLLPIDEFRAPADRAYDAMMRNLDGDGNLMCVSAAVYSALVDEHYWHVPLDRIVPWGQGPVLTAMAARAALNR